MNGLLQKDHSLAMAYGLVVAVFWTIAAGLFWFLAQLHETHATGVWPIRSHYDLVVSAVAFWWVGLAYLLVGSLVHACLFLHQRDAHVQS